MFENTFKNPGVLLKKYAKLVYAIGCIVTVLWVVSYVITAISAKLELKYYILQVCIIMLLGFGGSYIGGLTIYAFGELVDNSSKINNIRPENIGTNELNKEEILGYKKLYNMGALTEEEYVKKIEELMGL